MTLGHMTSPASDQWTPTLAHPKVELLKLYEILCVSNYVAIRGKLCEGPDSVMR
jgi:hypothetical protein